MDEKRKRAMSHKRRIRNLTSLCGLSAIILAVSTYAWFTGLQDVSVGTFQVEIAAADSMQLSLNGQDWSESLTFTKDDLTTKAYSATSFNWPSNGLVPVSSIGDMDSTSSRMVMYEKASMTTTPGGYRLIANKVANTSGAYEGAQGQNGFLAFDLFIKNFSGTAYFTENNVANEEAIYLTPDSKVSIGSSGIASSGIQKSVRVAFAQIGRVSAFNNTASQKYVIKDNPSLAEIALFKDNLIKFNVWSKIYKRWVVESYPYSTVRTYEDVRTIPVWIANAHKIVIMPSTEINYRAASGSIIRTNMVDTRLGTITAIAELFPRFANDYNVLKAMYGRAMVDLEALLHNHSSKDEGFNEMSRLNTKMLSYIYPDTYKELTYNIDMEEENKENIDQ